MKPLGDYYLQSTNPLSRVYGRPQGRCKECVRHQNGTHQRANRERASVQQRRWRLKNQYGITAEEYGRLHAAQGGRCSICYGTGDGRWKTLVVDHCHKTGKVRGLLCNTCNRVIGLLGDDSFVVREAVAYLLRGKAA